MLKLAQPFLTEFHTQIECQGDVAYAFSSWENLSVSVCKLQVTPAGEVLKGNHQTLRTERWVEWMKGYRGLPGDASGKIKADEGVSPALNLHSFGCCEQTSG